MPFPYIGGKKMIANKIIELFPENYYCYCELFCGSGAIFFNKKRKDKMEVLNDINGNIMNFFEILRDHGEQLKFELEALPYSSELYNRFWDIYVKNNYFSRLEQAVIFWYLSNVGHNAKICSKSGLGRGIAEDSANQPSKLISKVNKILVFRDRLKNVYLEKSDFEKIIKIYDGEGTLFYSDSPYIGAEKYYKKVFDFKLEDHERLAKSLHEIKGKAIVSYYDCPEVRAWYSDWHCTEIESYKVVDSIYGVKGMARKSEEKLLTNKIRTVELVLTNYKPNKYKQMSILDN